MITLPELKLFMDYADEDLSIGVNIPDNHVLCSLVFYIPNKELTVIHEITTVTREVKIFNKRRIDIHIKDFFIFMKKFEHDFCILTNPGYNYFDYADDQWLKYLKEKEQ